MWTEKIFNNSKFQSGSESTRSEHNQELHKKPNLETNVEVRRVQGFSPVTMPWSKFETLVKHSSVSDSTCLNPKESYHKQTIDAKCDKYVPSKQ